MTTPNPQELSENLLLAKLRDEDRQRLVPHMMVFHFTENHVLQDGGREVVDTWFPCGSALASFSVWVGDHNEAIEVALIGREGAIGGIVSNGNVPAFATSQVTSAGKFLRIKTSALEAAKIDSIALRHWFSRYSDCLLAQLFQTAACNAMHTITQRTAKWLLAGMARTDSVQFEITHDQLAKMLGVGRTFVTRILKQLRADGVIETRRGSLLVRNEAALRARSCDCTTAIEDHFDTVLHGVYPHD
jgi:CRP-like cAMP-binding protein